MLPACAKPHRYLRLKRRCKTGHIRDLCLYLIFLSFLCSAKECLHGRGATAKKIGFRSCRGVRRGASRQAFPRRAWEREKITFVVY